MKLPFNFCLLDAARMGPAIIQAKEYGENYVSLYKGRSMEDLADFSPYLFPLKQAPQLIDWLYENGWGNSWGIFLKSAVSPGDIFRHFRKFLIIKNEAGEDLYFRFYDPRVLRIFLPTCDEQQLIEFFGPVRHFFMEDEDPEYGLYFWLENGELKTQKSPKTELDKIFISKSKL